MKTNQTIPRFLLSIFCFLLLLAPASAATRYAWQESPSPAPPYTSWATAATNIQDAVDAAIPGDTVLVTNGVYATGGKAVGTNILVNRVAVDKPLSLLSVNGPEVTFIQGYQVPGTTNGDGAIRCAYLADGASLSGFTLTNGGTRTDNAGSGELEESGGGVLCESTNVVVTNCVLGGNAAARGGGARGGTLNNCILTGNSGKWGGGAYEATLNNCTLTANSAQFEGGGAYYGMLNNCTLTGNSASIIRGGGAYGGALNNCIIYYNTAPSEPNYLGTLNYCCTTPLPTVGVGNIDLDPQLASASHLSAGSPCIGAGSAAYVTGTDIDGEVWASPPSIGCDELCAGAVTGPLSVDIMAAFTNVAENFSVQLTGLIAGRTTFSVWDFGDGTAASNQPYASHAWAAPGDYAVVLSAFNESHPGGISATTTVHVVTVVHYVAADSVNPMPPYMSWATAATNIQDAVDVVTVPGALVLVTNGVYATGGRAVGINMLVNRVAVDKPLSLLSVNGPEVTIIEGYQVTGTTNGDGAIRCVYLADGASLSGFTLTNGATRDTGEYYREQSGGGVWCESINALVSNCVITVNVAYSSGGGAFQGTLNSCIFTRNSASGGGGVSGTGLNCTLNNCTLNSNSAAFGGGAHGGTLNNCTLTGNSASYGGGAYGGDARVTLNNCTLTDNSASSGGGAYLSKLIHCTLVGNSATYNGGGANSSTLSNCTLSNNSTTYSGGGAYASDLNNCLLTGNSASGGGGVFGGTLNNCTLTGNSAYGSGGAAGSYYLPCRLNNCIVYFNSTLSVLDSAEDQANYGGCTLNYSCTTPLPSSGVGNIDLDPQLASASHMSAASPCRGAGSAAYATGTDIDGEPWGDPPSMGCDEFRVGAVTGPLSVSIAADYTAVATGFPVRFTALIEGRTTGSRWELGRDLRVTNQPYASRAWTEAGDYEIVLRAFNESHPKGVAASVTIHVAAPVHYVAANSATPMPPYISWATAATNIGDAVAVEGILPGALILVTNGVYPRACHALFGKTDLSMSSAKASQ